MNDEFTAGTVRSVVGCSRKFIEKMVEARALTPANAHRGHGHHRRYSTSEIVAVAVGHHHRECGSSLDHAVGVVRYLSKLPIERLEAAIAEGRTHVVPSMLICRAARVEGLPIWLPGMLITPPNNPDMTRDARRLLKSLDIKPLVENVMKAIADLKEPKRGRRQEVVARMK